MLRWLAVALLSLTVVVAGPTGPAQALVKPPVIDGARLLGGAVEVGEGVARLKVIPGPVGAILTVGSLAWWAYNKYDTKVHAPQPGGNVDAWRTSPMPAIYPSSFNDGTIKATVASVSGRTLTLGWSCASWGYNSGSGGSTIWKCGSAVVSLGGNIGITTDQSVAKDVDCKNTTTGVHTTRALTLAGFGQGAYSVGASAPSTSYVNVANTECLSGEQIDGFRLDGRSTGTQGSGSTHRQTLPIGWGTMSGGTGWPSGQIRFDTAVIQAKCQNAATGAIQTISVTSAWGAGETLDIPSCKQRLGQDWYGIGVKVIPSDPKVDDLPLSPDVWPDWDVPDFVPEEWVPDDLTPEEDADPCHDTKEGCGLSIWIDSDPVWPGSTTRTKIDTIHNNEPSRLKCKWGTREVDWKFCIPLLPTYEPGAGTSINTDPTKPDTGTGTPTTGTGTQTLPTEAGTCMKAAWSWNPVDWVFVPVKCVLTWAFVPTTWPDWGSIPNPIPSGWVPSFPALTGGSCGVVNMPGGLNLGPLLPHAGGGKLFDTCEWAAARNVTYYGTLALLLVVVGTRGYRAVMNALGMAVEGTAV